MTASAVRRAATATGPVPRSHQHVKRAGEGEAKAVRHARRQGEAEQESPSRRPGAVERIGPAHAVSIAGRRGCGRIAGREWPEPSAPSRRTAVRRGGRSQGCRPAPRAGRGPTRARLPRTEAHAWPPAWRTAEARAQGERRRAAVEVGSRRRRNAQAGLPRRAPSRLPNPVQTSQSPSAYGGRDFTAGEGRENFSQQHDLGHDRAGAEGEQGTSRVAHGVECEHDHPELTP